MLNENHSCVQKQQDYSCSNVLPREDASTNKAYKYIHIFKQIKGCVIFLLSRINIQPWKYLKDVAPRDVV